jgi:hypothetical protein
MAPEQQPDYIPALGAAWGECLAALSSGSAVLTALTYIQMRSHCAKALPGRFRSRKLRSAVAELYLCDALSRPECASIPGRDDELTSAPICIDVADADPAMLLWFVQRQTDGAAPGPDMGGIPQGVPTVASFGLYSLRECAMRCLHALLQSDEGRKRLLQSPQRDPILAIAISWCEYAFLSEFRGYAKDFKAFAGAAD